MDEVTLSPLAQRYIATCYVLPDRALVDLAYARKEEFRASAQRGEPRLVDVAGLSPAFPNLGRLLRDDVIPADGVEAYFEGLAGVSHNLRMYQFARRLLREPRPLTPEHEERRRHALESMLEHVEGCSVRPAVNVDGKGIVWGYHGPQHSELDTSFFGAEEHGPLVYVHGKRDGRPVIIKGVRHDAFGPMADWWEARAASLRRPFARAGLAGR